MTSINSHSNWLIRPGTGVGQLKLRMQRTGVHALLGKPLTNRYGLGPCKAAIDCFAVTAPHTSSLQLIRIDYDRGGKVVAIGLKGASPYLNGLPLLDCTYGEAQGLITSLDPASRTDSYGVCSDSLGLALQGPNSDGYAESVLLYSQEFVDAIAKAPLEHAAVIDLETEEF